MKIRFVLATLILLGAGCKQTLHDSIESALNNKPNTEVTSTNKIDYGYGEGNLPLGDNKISSSPKVGYIYSCDQHPRGGGAFKDGPWIHSEEGYWDPSEKVHVDGDVAWPNAMFSISTEGNRRMFTGNSLPTDHNTGTYPISSKDDAYQYDRNPNTIKENDLDFSLPTNPELASAASCASGTVAIALNGVPIFNGFDAGGRDAVAHEIQDSCDGHPQIAGQYHYHDMSACADDNEYTGAHSDLIGYTLDGFGLYGMKDEDGATLTNEDLDECHGHTHEIEWDGKMTEMYHYHATAEFPYTVSCFRGSEVAHIDTAQGEPRR